MPRKYKFPACLFKNWVQPKMALAIPWDEGIIGNMKIQAYLSGIFLRRK